MSKQNITKYYEHLGDWTEILDEAIEAFEKDARPVIRESIAAGKQVFPHPDNIFRAFRECPHEDVKVVILGQDPYFDGSATGLAFDNQYPTKKISPSLRNILAEMGVDSITTTTQSLETNGSYLGNLPEQGVLLLNTALTVEKGAPASHAKAWRGFTNEVIKQLNKKDGIIWVLWGAHALSYKDKIDNENHYFIISSHPSPLAYTKGLRNYPPFKRSQPFSKVNDILQKLNLGKIKW